MKTITDFKRAMQIGTKWQATHQWIHANGELLEPIKDMGIRECRLHNTVDFGFKTDHNTISHSRWPKKMELSFNGDTVIITTSFCQLKYTQVK